MAEHSAKRSSCAGKKKKKKKKNMPKRQSDPPLLSLKTKRDIEWRPYLKG